MKQLTYILIMASFCFFSCNKEDVGEAEGAEGGKNSIVVTYTIPSATAAAPVSTRTFVEATGKESALEDLYLLFFEPDKHGNGVFTGYISAAIQTGGSMNQNSITITVPAGSPIDIMKEYAVLALGNLDRYITAPTTPAIFLGALNGKTYNEASAELQVGLPVTNGVYGFPNDGILPMGGFTVKPAGRSDMEVNLLRAVARVDVKVKEGLIGIELKEANLSNVALTVPYFRTQGNIASPRASSQRFSVTGGSNALQSKFYAVESLLDASDGHTLLNQVTCMLINVKAPIHNVAGNAAKTWYRVNLSVNGNGLHHLKRNNAYTVVITEVNNPGATTPEEAYGSKSVLIGSVTVPTDWAASGVTPPEIEIH